VILHYVSVQLSIDDYTINILPTSRIWNYLPVIMYAQVSVTYY